LTVGIKYRVRGSRDDLICTGTLLSGQHVLTAGHCGCGIPDSYEVIIDGDLNRQQAIARSLSVPPALFDPRVCNTGRLYGGDLALLTLKIPVACPVAADTPANLRNGNAAVNGQGVPLRSDCRPAYAQNAPGKTFGYPDVLAAQLADVLLKGAKLTAVGYGYNEKHEIGRRAWVPIPIISPDCAERPWSRTCAPFAEIVLAEARGGKPRSDTCNGDSGGPIFLIKDGDYTLIGVTSRAAPGIGDDPELHCGGGGIYTLIGRKSVQAWLSAHGVQRSLPLAARSAAKPN